MSKLERKMKVGHPVERHGGFSFMVKGELPKRRAYLRRYLSNVREGLIEDLGGSKGEDGLSTAKLVIVDRVISKLGVVRCIEEYHKRRPVIVKGELTPSLGKHYLAYTNSIRLDLALLGIERRLGDIAIDPIEYIQGKGGEKDDNGEG